jgi:hypothetical protein
MDFGSHGVGYAFGFYLVRSSMVRDTGKDGLERSSCLPTNYGVDLRYGSANGTPVDHCYARCVDICEIFLSIETQI